ncbi:hypothetical protein THIOM_002461 [Candidatus Thiomargarita nelsonii]|uniref:Uncharacterized protein n=1 Tax=Candidatus Thiomargarita nelsonii TaxID=1003181 RepID=A0A176S1F6_9GAMM|nr:hypothetical protein THIOM_002461 [Candidatus Thiomargarita nelsonii]
MIANGCNIFAPSPQFSASGNNPITVVSVVIKIGRRRHAAAAIMATCTGCPAARCNSMVSTSTMALLTTMPANSVSVCARPG